MKTLEQRVAKLMDLGFSPALAGFNAILAMVDVWKPGEKFCIYYAIAGKRLGISGPRVERNIRHAIEKAMCYNRSGMSEFLRNTYDPVKGYPTNHEFIAVLWMDFNTPET